MGFQTINFADVEDFEPLPEDEYAVEIEKVEVRSNKAGDGLYLNWEMTVIDGEYENRRLWMITSLKPTALFRLKAVFEALDVLDDDEMELEFDDDVEPTTSAGPRLLYPEVEGMEATAIVKNEMYEGKEKNRVEELLGDEKPKRKKRKAATVDKKSSKARTKSRRRDEEDDDDEEDEEEDERPTRRGSAKRAGSSKSGTRSRRDKDEEEDEEDDDEKEERPRSRRASSRTTSKSRRREEEPDDDDEDDDDEEEAPPRRRSRSSTASAGGRAASRRRKLR